MPQLTRAKTFCFLFRQLRNAAWMKMNFKPSLSTKSRGENYTHSSKLWNHLEILGQNPVVYVFSDFTWIFNQDVINNVGEIACKDGLQVFLQIEPCEGIKGSIKHVLKWRPIQYHKAEWALSQLPSLFHSCTFQNPLGLADQTSLLRKGNFTVTSWR